MIELVNIAPDYRSPLIAHCQIKVCWVGDTPNRNKTVITKEVAMEMAPSLRGAPLVGFYNEETQDFEQHNEVISLKDGRFEIKSNTVPYGFIDLNADVWFQDFLDPDGVQREYLCTEGWLWAEQFPECKRVIEKGNNQSMELDQSTLVGVWANFKNENGKFFIINEAIISKLCILGENYEPCFEGASITEFSLGDNFKNQLYSVISDIKNILEGGMNVADEVKDTVVEEEAPVFEESAPAVEDAPSAEFSAEEETKEEVCPECGKPLAECECEKDKNEKYNLEEISEYIELQEKYSLLETELAQIKEALASVEAEKANLAEFKLNVEKKEKEALIDSFYMLSDEQKADVRENIDTYSLEDIKSKLCVICVDNKVGFAEETPSQEPITYSLNDIGSSNEEDIPDWIKAVKAINK